MTLVEFMNLLGSWEESTVSEPTPYSIKTDVRFGPLEIVDVAAIAAACKEQWFSQTLSEVNDCVVRLAVVRGEFHWHVHDNEDEFFFVVSGHLFIDVDDDTIFELTPRQGLLVPRGVRHRTRAVDRTVILVIEGSSVTLTGD